MLRDALEGSPLRTGAQVVSFDQDADGVTVHFADGGSERGDLLIFDVYPYLRGYKVDATRTYSVGPATDQIRWLHELLEHALAAGAARGTLAGHGANLRGQIVGGVLRHSRCSCAGDRCRARPGLHPMGMLVPVDNGGLKSSHPRRDASARVAQIAAQPKNQKGNSTSVSCAVADR